MAFRLHIDVPFDPSWDEDKCRNAAEKIMEVFGIDVDDGFYLHCGVDQINYRLGNDEDRQKSNYFRKTDNGHVSTKKCTIHSIPTESIDTGLTSADDVV